MCFEKSKITASLTVCPARPVPHPRAPIGASWRRQISTAISTSAADRGITTPSGTWRCTEPSFAYSARLPAEKRTSPRMWVASSCASARRSVSVACVAIAARQLLRDALPRPAQHARWAGRVLHLSRQHARHRERYLLAVGLAPRQPPREALGMLGIDRRRQRHVVRIDDGLD